MKRLQTASITNSAQFPVKSGTLDFLQDAWKEAIDALVKNIVGNAYDPIKVYILFGCVNSGTGSDYDISAGAVFFNGEVYLVDAVVFTAADDAVANFVTTQYTTNADPVTFTDGISRNVHNIKKIEIVDAVSGTGIADFVDFIDASGNVWRTGNDTTGAGFSGVTATLVSYNYRYLEEKTKVTMSFEAHINVTVGAGATTFMALNLPLPTPVSSPVGRPSYGTGVIIDLVASTFDTVHLIGGPLGTATLGINSNYNLPVGDYYIYGQIVYEK